MRFIIFLLFIFLFSCDPIPEESETCHREILIKNVGTNDIWFSFEPFDDPIQKLRCDFFGVIRPDSIQSNSSTLTSCWEDLITNLYEDSVSYYFISDSSYQDNFPCDSILISSPIVEERQYSIEELNALDWLIEYP